jgi:hypothetical protein
VLALNGFVGAQRYKVLSRYTDLHVPGQYVAIYEMHTDDPHAAFEALGSAAQTGKMHVSDALDLATVSVTVLAPIA